MLLSVIKNQKSKKFIVKMVDYSGTLVSMETGKSPSEVLEKINFRICNSQNEEYITILEHFRNLIATVPKNVWFS